MQFELDQSMAILERTPRTLAALLEDLPREWTRVTEGGESWSAYTVLGHLIHGERADWIPRAKIILEAGESRTFEPFDRFAQLRDSEGKSLEELLVEFADLRRRNLSILRSLGLERGDFAKLGVHPDLGVVTLGQLLSTWVVHDLGHLAQIARVMSRRYAEDVGPWSGHLPILGRQG